MLDGSGFPKRSQIFPCNVSEPSTLAQILSALGALEPGSLDLPHPTVVLDAGLASEANIQWLSEQQIPYLVVSRRQHREFDPEQAVVVKEDKDVTIQVQKKQNPETGELELYCHSTAREKKDQAINDRFAERFEAGLETLQQGLNKKNGTTRYAKVMERIGRLKEKYARMAQYYEIQVVKDPESDRVTEITWTRKSAPRTDHPGVYCLRTNQLEWDESDALADLSYAHRIGGGLPQPQIRARPKAHIPSESGAGGRPSVHQRAGLPLGPHTAVPAQRPGNQFELG